MVSLIFWKTLSAFEENVFPAMTRSISGTAGGAEKKKRVQREG